jgi:hypothetical protein
MNDLGAIMNVPFYGPEVAIKPQSNPYRACFWESVIPLTPDLS